MADTNYKSKDGVSIETEGQGCTSLIQSADQNNDYNAIDNSDETLVKTVIPSVQQTIANQVPNQQAENVINDSISNLQTNGKDYYYSTIKDVNNIIGTARTPFVQPAIPNRVQNQQTENVISDSELKSRLNTINDNINLLKNKNYRLKIGFIILLFVIFVAIGATSSAMAVIFKQNLEDSLKRITETNLANTNEARVSEDTWTHWSNWDACSPTCNVGVRRRTRACNGTSQDGLTGTCSGNDLDISTCTNEDCIPRVSEGVWASWSIWGECSVTCNAGVRSRNRACDGQDGRLGICSGNGFDISSCSDKDCNRGIWAQWLNWEACSTTCNAGVRRRKRTCNSRYGQHRFCLGTDVDISICNNADCTRSNWAQWLNWEACSTTYNAGVRIRKRTCNSQYGQKGFCLGNDVDISSCNNDECTPEPGPSDVSFTSYLTTSLTNVRIGTTVVFDGTRHNAGNAYNASTGVLTCPTAGTFLFSMTVSSFNNKTTALRMKVDGISKTFTFSHNTMDRLLTSTSTTILVYHLNNGQRVWVETYNKDNTDIYRGYTSFVGVLIHR